MFTFHVIRILICFRGSSNIETMNKGLLFEMGAGRQLPTGPQTQAAVATLLYNFLL